MQKQSAEYQPPEGAEAEAEPGSRGRVLRNNVGIGRKRGMDKVEYEAPLRAQEAALEELTPRTRFTTRLLCRMHGDWLNGIYKWAGLCRSVDVSKDGSTWPPAPVPECAQRRAGVHAEVHAELLRIHPFREGNGRLARWLADLMALQARLSYPIYGFVGRGNGRQRARYLAAVKQGDLMRYDDLTGFFIEALERGLIADV